MRYFIAFLLIGICCVLLCCKVNQLPNPKGVRTPTNEFSEERAMNHVKVLSEEIGPRTATDKHQIERTRNYINQFIEYLTPTANSNGWKIVTVNLPVSGEYYWNHIQYVYQNLNNLLIKIEPMNSNNHLCQGALLTNVHIDSAVSSPAAGDDGVAVSIALESIRALISIPSHENSFPYYFLFNNGEELGLLGSHGFVTQHPDIIEQIGAFINLEAAGTYGPESLFQAGPKSDTVGQYSKHVPFPRGSVVAQDLFRAGIIPSYTDYQVFVKFGNLSGIDMALYRNGYVYHTPKDSIENISSGTIQHFGSNVLALLQNYDGGLLWKSSDTCKDINSNGDTHSVTYFDIGGVFMACYGKIVNMTVTICICSTFIFSFWLRSRCKLQLHSVWNYVCVLISYILILTGGIITPLFIAWCLTSMNLSLLWFRSPLSSILFYFPIASFGVMLFCYIMIHFIKIRCFSLLIQWNGITIFYSIVLILGCLFNIGATYIVLFYTLCSTIIVFYIASHNNSIFLDFLFHFSFVIPSFALIDLSIQFVETIVPTAGRAGLKPVEYVVASLGGLTISLIFLPMLPYIYYSKKKTKQYFLFVFLLLSLIGAISLPGRIYSPETPKRVLIQHVTDVTEGEEYILFIPSDSIPLSANDMPLTSFPQQSNTQRYHAPLATIPSLKLEEGNRWEMNTNSKSPYQPQMNIHSTSDKMWDIEINAPEAFTVELWFSPCNNLVSVGNSVNNTSFITPCDIHKVRLIDGNGIYNTNISVEVLGDVQIEVFVNYLNVPEEVIEIVDTLPSYFASVYASTHKFLKEMKEMKT